MMLERERDNKLLNAHALTAAIVHEVRQPLAAIAVYASAALRFIGKTPPDLAEVRLALNNMIKDTYRTSDVLEGFRALFEKSDQKTEQVRVTKLSWGSCSHRGKSYRIIALKLGLSWRPNCRLSSRATGGNWRRSSLTWSTTRSKQWMLRRSAIGSCW